MTLDTLIVSKVGGAVAFRCRFFAVVGAAGVPILGGVQSASASESRTGYRECAGSVGVTSTTAALNSSYYAIHRLTYQGQPYPSDTFFSDGYHAWTFFGLPGGNWQAYTSNGTMSAASSYCA